MPWEILITVGYGEVGQFQDESTRNHGFVRKIGFAKVFESFSPPYQSIESHVQNWWPDPADNFLVRSAAAGLKVLQPQR